MGAGGVIQSPGVTLDGDGGGELGDVVRGLLERGLGDRQVDLGFLSVAGVQDGDSGEAGHGDHDGNGVGVDLAEGQVGGHVLAGGELEEQAAAVDGAPHTPRGSVEQLDQGDSGTGAVD